MGGADETPAVTTARSRTAATDSARFSTCRAIKRRLEQVNLTSPPTEKRLTQHKPLDEAFVKLQNILAQYENDCAKEQLEVERKYAAKMEDLYHHKTQPKRNQYEERRKMVSQIPSFWGDVLRASFPFVSKTDELVFPYIEDLHVNTCLDDLGSYQVTVRLAASNPFIEEENITRTVRVTQNDTAECSSISWKMSVPQEDDSVTPSFFDFLRSEVGDLQHCSEAEILDILKQLHRFPMLPGQ